MRSNDRRNVRRHSKKRKFHGNKKKTVKEMPKPSCSRTNSSENCSSSRKELKLDNTSEELSNNNKNYYVLMDITILISFFENICKCPQCNAAT